MGAYEDARERVHSSKRIELARAAVFALLAIVEELDVLARHYARAQTKGKR